MRHLDTEFVIAADVDTVLAYAAGSMAGLRNASSEPGLPGHIVITETWRPLWTFVVAVVLFPLGLLALLSQSDAVLVVSAKAAGESGTQVRIIGRGHEAVCDRLLAAFDLAKARATSADATS